MKARIYAWLVCLALISISGAVLSEDEIGEFSIEPVLDTESRINGEIVLSSDKQTDEIPVNIPPIIGSDSVSGDSGFAQIHSYDPNLSLYSILVKNISGSDNHFNIPYVNKLSYKINNGPNESDIMEVSRNLLCHWKENSKLKVDKLIKGNLHYMGYLAPLDNDGNEQYHHAACDADVYRAEKLSAGGYCVEFRGNDCLKVTISYPKSTGNWDYKNVTNICCKLDGQDVAGLRRGYFEMKNDAQGVSVQIRFKDEKNLNENIGESESIMAYNYALKLRRTRPVVFIHDAGDGPLNINYEGSHALGNIRSKMPYIADFQPMKLVEFPWDASDAACDFEEYATKTGLLNKSLEDNFKKWPLKPMFICNGVGGLILTKLMENSEDVAKNIRGIAFLGTPFFGSQIANHIRVNKDVDSEFLGKLRVMASIDNYISFNQISNKNLDKICNGNEEVWNRRDKFAENNQSKYLNLGTTHVFFGDASSDLHTTIQGHASAYANKISILTPCLSAAVGLLGVVLCFGPGTQAGGMMLLCCATYSAGMATLSCMSAQDAYDTYKYNVRVDGAKIIKDMFDIHGDGIVSISSADLPKNMGWQKAKRHCLDGYNHGDLSIVKFPLENGEEDKVITVIKELAKETDEEKSK